MSYPANTAWRAYAIEFNDRAHQLRCDIEEGLVRVENLKACAPDMVDNEQRYLDFHTDALRICEACLETIDRMYRDTEGSQ